MSTKVSGLKRFKPITSSLRHRVIVDRTGLWSGRPYKPLTVGLSQSGGRNNRGRITVRHRGGGHKRLYRLVDLCSYLTSPGRVVRVEYDPNRSSWIFLVSIGSRFYYVLATEGMFVGDSFNVVPFSLGSVHFLGDIPIGTKVHSVEMVPGQGAKLARSAGTSVEILAKASDLVWLKFPSRRQVLVSSKCRAIIGSISNPSHSLVRLGKAGCSRWLGRRPSVRGEAMNPVDHPLGGRTRGGRFPVSPWGKLARGGKTSSKLSRVSFLPKF